MRKLKRTTVQAIIAFFIIMLLLVGVAGGVYYITTKKLNDHYGKELDGLWGKLQEVSRTYYTPTANIQHGQVINEKNVSKVQGYLSINSENLMTGEDLGKVALVDLKPLDVITTSMISEDQMEEGLREEEYNAFHLSSNLLTGDTVDIRIYFPNGENYIVLSKKQLKNLDFLARSCQLWLNEEETLLISSAIVDAYLYPGTTIYTAKYPEPAIQEESEITYVPKANVIELIERDPNIIDRAKLQLSKEIRKTMEAAFPQEEEKEGSSGVPAEEKESSFDKYLYGNGEQSETIPSINDITSTTNGTTTGEAIGQEGEENKGYWNGGGDQ